MSPEQITYEKRPAKTTIVFQKKISTNAKAKTQRFAESLYFLTHVMLAFCLILAIQ